MMVLARARARAAASTYFAPNKNLCPILEGSVVLYHNALLLTVVCVHRYMNDAEMVDLVSNRSIIPTGIVHEVS